MNTTRLLMNIIGSEMRMEKLSEEVCGELSESDLAELYDLATYHDMAHVVGDALDRIGGFDGEIYARFAKARMIAVFRMRRLIDELSRLSNFLEKEKIDHIPLKGSVLRNFYPEPWMRTSCDIDILVKKEDLQRASDALVSSMGYSVVSKTTHDISFDSPTGVHLELHFLLIEDGFIGAKAAVLKKIWDFVITDPDKSYTFHMPDEIFYLYHIAHMAKHVVSGGCGIKSFVDLWILENRVDFDAKKRAALVCESGLSLFEKGAKRLADVWFCGAEKDELSASFESFVLSGGVYGTVQNGVSIGVAKKQSRFKYALSRIFLPYEKLKLIYPTLEKHKWLSPFYQVRRFLRVVFKGGLKRAKAQLSKSKSISSEEIADTVNVLVGLGLKND